MSGILISKLSLHNKTLNGRKSLQPVKHQSVQNEETRARTGPVPDRSQIGHLVVINLHNTLIIQLIQIPAILFLSHRLQQIICLALFHFSVKV